MGWKIHEWNSETRRGVVYANDFGAFHFDASKIDNGVEFLINESVSVDLWGERGNYTLHKIIKESYRRQAHIDGYECAYFEAVNVGYEYLNLLENSSTCLRVEACHGDMYTPRIEVAFNRPSRVEGFAGEFEFESPWFRYATRDEIGNAEIPKGERAYFIVGTESNPNLKAGALVIAASVVVGKTKTWPTDY